MTRSRFNYIRRTINDAFGEWDRWSGHTEFPQQHHQMVEALRMEVIAAIREIPIDPPKPRVARARAAAS